MGAFQSGTAVYAVTCIILCVVGWRQKKTVIDELAIAYSVTMALIFAVILERLTGITGDRVAATLVGGQLLSFGLGFVLRLGFNRFTTLRGP